MGRAEFCTCCCPLQYLVAYHFRKTKQMNIVCHCLERAPCWAAVLFHFGFIFILNHHRTRHPQYILLLAFRVANFPPHFHIPRRWVSPEFPACSALCITLYLFSPLSEYHFPRAATSTGAGVYAVRHLRLLRYARARDGLQPVLRDSHVLPAADDHQWRLHCDPVRNLQPVAGEG